MGGSTIAGFVMMFFGIIIMLSTFVVVFTTVMESNQALSDQQARDREMIQTSIKMTNLTYYRLAGTDRTVIEITNDGKRKLETDTIDIYIDDVRINRNDINRVEDFKGPNAINPLHFDPGEIYQINISMEIENGTHIVVASTEYGVVTSDQFTYGT